MSAKLEKQIASARSVVEKLEAELEQTRREDETLERVSSELRTKLAEGGVSFDAFVRFAEKDIRKALVKLDKKLAIDAPKPEQSAEEAPKRRGRGKKKAEPAKRGAKAAKPGRAAKGKPRAKPAIKIQAGRYTNMPPNPEAVIEVKEKGPRPRVVMNYAMEIGLDEFMSRCRIHD